MHNVYKHACILLYKVIKTVSLWGCLFLVKYMYQLPFSSWELRREWLMLDLRPENIHKPLELCLNNFRLVPWCLNNFDLLCWHIASPILSVWNSEIWSSQEILILRFLTIVICPGCENYFLPLKPWLASVLILKYIFLKDILLQNKWNWYCHIFVGNYLL